MPTNVTYEYNLAEQEYSKASTVQDKIKALEKMYATVPKHKGTEKLRKEIKTKLAKFRGKLKKEQERKTKGYSISIKKEGDATIVLVGPTNSGKSLLLNKLTNKKLAIADYPFTTKTPVVGIMKYKGVKLQVIELPAIVEGYYNSEKGGQFFSIIRNADLVVIVTDTENIDFLFKEFDNARIKLNEKLVDEDYTNLKAVIIINKIDFVDSEKIHQSLSKYYNFDLVKISALNKEDIELLKDEIWKHLGLIKIYTKEPGKSVSREEPLCLEKGSTIKDMAAHIHKDFIKKFKFARVWGKSVKYDGSRVGVNHLLEDDDIVELHLK